VLFGWDAEKAKKNLAKHGVSFDETATIFGDLLAVTIEDPAHSREEQRFLTTGLSKAQRLLIVTHSDTEVRMRIISARRTTRREMKQYESGD